VLPELSSDDFRVLSRNNIFWRKGKHGIALAKIGF